MMNYSGAFAWYLGAKRSNLLHIRDHFDKTFQLPFVVTFHVFWVGFFCMIMLIVLDEFF